MLGHIIQEEGFLKFISFIDFKESQKYKFYWDCHCCMKQQQIIMDEKEFSFIHNDICQKCGEKLRLGSTLIEIKKIGEK